LKVYIVDASVAVRFLLIGDLSEKARLVLEGFRDDVIELKAPSLVRYEVGNTLWKAVRQRLISASEASQKFSDFLKLQLDSVELDEQECLDALSWAVENNTTYYDSVYVKASEKTGATLLTADDALHEKASKDVPTMHLRSLERR
jgi:predicted nucleic acid-binding protein